MTPPRTTTRLPRRLLLSCSVVVLCFSPQATAFAPRLKPLHQVSYSSVNNNNKGIFASSIEQQDTSSSTKTTWIDDEIERHIRGETLIDDQCIIGPKHVLIYDTSLRGTRVVVHVFVV